MTHRNRLAVVTCLAVGACSAAAQAPKWEDYRARPLVESANPNPTPNSPPSGLPDRIFRLRDLQTEPDQSLAARLLGANGARIAFIDRQKERWQYYQGPNDGVEEIDLYTHPESWGTAFGICKVEHYNIGFDDSGMIEQVRVEHLFGIEGDIFQKDDFDWQRQSELCKSAKASNAPSYFPAEDVLRARDLAQLLATAIFEASSKKDLSYQLKCETYQKQPCASDIREYLGNLRLDEIDRTTYENCPPLNRRREEYCFTVTVGEQRLGPFPKQITIIGSTYMNDVVVKSIDVREDLTIS